MKVLLQLFSLVIFTTLFSFSSQTEQLLASNDICRLFKDGTKLRKPGTCNEGIVCNNFVSTPGVQCEQQWYSIDSSGCVTLRPDDSYCKATCALKSPNFVSDRKNCHGWYRCNGSKELSSGTCPAGQLFDQKEQRCRYDVECIASFEFCDIVPKGIPFRNENNCRQYFMCNKKNVAEVFHCESGKYFDRATGACVTKSMVDCPIHPYPDNVCGNTKIAYRNRFVSDEATCRGYFYCKDLGAGKPDIQPNWGQCPQSQFFNPIIQACQLRYHVKCNEDRCDSRKSGELEISGKNGCQHYLKCGDGFTAEEIYCGDGLYYDAENAICTTVRKWYGACA